MPSAIYKSVWWDGTPQLIIELSLKQGNVWHWQWGRCATSTPLTKAGYSSSLQSHNVESENSWNLKTTDVLFPLVDIGILIGWLIEGFEQTPLTTGMMTDYIPNRPKPIFSKRTLLKTTSLITDFGDAFPHQIPPNSQSYGVFDTRPILFNGLPCLTT